MILNGTDTISPISHLADKILYHEGNLVAFNISLSVMPVHPSVCDSVFQPVCHMVETDTTSLVARTLSSTTSYTVHFPLRSGESLQSRGLGKCQVAQADSRLHHSTPSVSTTPSFCHGSGTKMTVVCGDQVAQPHVDTGADRHKSSSTPVGGSGELLQASVGTSCCGLNPSSHVFLPRHSDVQQVNGAGKSVQFPQVVDRSDCLHPWLVPRWCSGFQVCWQGARWLRHWCRFEEWYQNWVCLW